MSTCCNVMGFETAMLVKSGTGTIDFTSGTERYAILTEDISANIELQGRNRITGDRTTRTAYMRKKGYVVQGTIVLQPGAADLDAWLPRIMGAAGVGDVFGLGDTWTPFGILLYTPEGCKVIEGCRVNYAVFQSAHAEGGEGEEFVALVLNIIGTYYEHRATSAAQSPLPTLVMTQPHLPYTHWEGEILYGAGPDELLYRSFSIQINNFLKPIFYNGFYASCVRSRGRRIILQTESPFCDDLFGLSFDWLDEAVEVYLTLSRADGGNAVNTEFYFPAAMNNYKSPLVKGKDEVPLHMMFEATGANPNSELVITNDATW